MHYNGDYKFALSNVYKPGRKIDSADYMLILFFQAGIVSYNQSYGRPMKNATTPVKPSLLRSKENHAIKF